MPGRIRLGKGRLEPGRMNGLEKDYALVLEARKRAGEVSEYHFEAVTFKLAHDCRLTPDFFVVLADGTVEFHDAKGFFREDAKIKMRVAADKFPFRFLAVRRLTRRQGGGWAEEVFCR